MKNKNIIILDFSTGEVHIFPYDENILVSLEEDKLYNFNISNCQYMIVDELKINIH